MAFAIMERVGNVKAKDIRSTLQKRISMLEAHIKKVEEKKPKGYGLQRFLCNERIADYTGLLDITG